MGYPEDFLFICFTKEQLSGNHLSSEEEEEKDMSDECLVRSHPLSKHQQHDDKAGSSASVHPPYGPLGI